MKESATNQTNRKFQLPVLFIARRKKMIFFRWPRYDSSVLFSRLIVPSCFLFTFALRLFSTVIHDYWRKGKKRRTMEEKCKRRDERKGGTYLLVRVEMHLRQYSQWMANRSPPFSPWKIKVYVLISREGMFQLSISSSSILLHARVWTRSIFIVVIFERIDR